MNDEIDVPLKRKAQWEVTMCLKSNELIMHTMVFSGGDKKI